MTRRSDRAADQRDQGARRDRPRRRAATPTSRPASASSTTCSPRSASTACSTSPSRSTATCTSTRTTPSRTPPSPWVRPSPQAAGDKAGTRRFGDALIPMDEALVQAAVDLSGRPYLVHREPDGAPPTIGPSLRHHPDPARLRVLHLPRRRSRLHLIVLSGRDWHHVTEAQYKALARALRAAVEIDPRVRGVPSTKGVVCSLALRGRRARLRVGQPALGPARAGTGRRRRSRSPPTPPRRVAADGLVVPGRRRLRRLHARADRGRRAGGGGRAAGGRATGARHLRRHAGAVRGRRRARRARPPAWACWPGGSSRCDAPVLPHMGWNTVDVAARLARCSPGCRADTRFYFVHSYGAPAAAPAPARPIDARTASRSSPPSSPAPLSATQFHPEKSGDAGAHLLGTGWRR